MNAADPSLPPTATRVEHSTADKINARIERATAENVARIAAAGPAAMRATFSAVTRSIRALILSAVLCSTRVAVGGRDGSAAFIDLTRCEAIQSKQRGDQDQCEAGHEYSTRNVQQIRQHDFTFVSPLLDRLL